MSRDKKMVEFEDVEQLDATWEAFKFKIDGETVWLPRSQVKVIAADHIEIPEWLAKDRGLI